MDVIQSHIFSLIFARKFIHQNTIEHPRVVAVLCDDNVTRNY
jgi:hypothetical protein